MTVRGQPTPTVTAADVERIVRRDFPAERTAEVLAMLDEYGTEEWQRETHRVRLAALKLAGRRSRAVALRGRGRQARPSRRARVGGVSWLQQAHVPDQ